MWNRLIDTNLPETQRLRDNRVEGYRLEGNRVNWLVVLAIVLGVV